MKTKFTYSARMGENIESICLVGDFNQWDAAATPMAYSPHSNMWEVEIDLPQGGCQYKFLINGIQWINDPCAGVIPNDVAGLNSVRHISAEGTTHATFSPSSPTLNDEIVITSCIPGKLHCIANGWKYHPSPESSTRIKPMERYGDGAYRCTIKAADLGVIPEYVTFQFEMPDGSYENNGGNFHWIPIDLQLQGRHVDTSFYSSALGEERPFMLYLPKGHNEKRRRKYPLVLLLHGYGGDYRQNWCQSPVLKRLADEYGVVLAWPDGNVMIDGRSVPSWYINAPGAPHSRMEDYITGELIPHIETEYNVSTNRNNKAVAGISMGGYSSFYLAVKYPEMFSAAGSMSGVFDLFNYRHGWDIQRLVSDKWQEFNVINAVQQAKDTAFRFIVGDEEETIMGEHYYLKEAMKRNGIEHTFEVHPGSHTIDFWRHHLEGMMRFAAERICL